MPLVCSELGFIQGKKEEYPENEVKVQKGAMARMQTRIYFARNVPSYTNEPLWVDKRLSGFRGGPET